RLEGRVRVRDGLDDDYLGFVFGFEPGDTSNAQADYLLVDWKKDDQTSTSPCPGPLTGVRGLAVSRVRGIPANYEYSTHIDHPCTLDGGVEELARGLNLGDVGWQSNRDYVFRMDYTPDRFRVFVDGQLEIDLEGNFPPGRFGFENQSQKEVRYSAFADPTMVSEEGESLPLNVFFVDPGLFDVHSAAIDWGDGSVTGGAVTTLPSSSLVTGSHVFLDDGSYDAEVCVDDDDGGTDCGTFPIQVRNVAPAVEAGEDHATSAGVVLDLADLPFTDPGVLDTHTAIVDWGDGTNEPAAVAQEAGGGTVSASHVYSVQGVYTAEVCVTDDDGGTGCDTLAVEVTASPILAAIKTDAVAYDANGDGVVNPGDRVRYEITVSNAGAGTATGVALSDAIPANAAVVAGSVASSQGTTVSSDPVVVDLGTLASGTAATVSFEIELQPLPIGTAEIVNQAVVSSNELADVLSDDPDTSMTADPTVTPVAGDPQLAAVKTDALVADNDGDGSPSPGDAIGYTVEISNSGSGAASG
ncbi:MAG: DUF11 domain-containing protein, partial [bacterium]|nr:DUF11 domain-containing protein [bacterium]